jgi:mannose-6-phosphate isomerase-like protein (cupin superfamily)
MTETSIILKEEAAVNVCARRHFLFETSKISLGLLLIGQALTAASNNNSKKMNRYSITSQPLTSIPPDDPQRHLKLARPETDESLPHLGVVGDTYTIVLSGEDTDGRFCLIDMHVPPEGGPPPHRHDFEETFIVLEGEIEATFRGEKRTVKAGETINVPANAPHQFHNLSSAATRMLCICAPAGQEEFFKEVGTPVATRTTAPPKLGKAAQEAFIKKVQELTPKYRTELLKD